MRLTSQFEDPTYSCLNARWSLGIDARQHIEIFLALDMSLESDRLWLEIYSLRSMRRLVITGFYGRFVPGGLAGEVWISLEGQRRLGMQD